jgi:hypothetical protein
MHALSVERLVTTLTTIPEERPEYPSAESADEEWKPDPKKF